MCVFCERQGRVTTATVVDHVEPVRERPDLAFDSRNFMSLCSRHHSSSKQRAERAGRRVIGCDVEGRPLDPGHYWNRNP